MGWGWGARGWFQDSQTATILSQIREMQGSSQQCSLAKFAFTIWTDLWFLHFNRKFWWLPKWYVGLNLHKLMKNKSTFGIREPCHSVPFPLQVHSCLCAIEVLLFPSSEYGVFLLPRLTTWKKPTHFPKIHCKLLLVTPTLNTWSLLSALHLTSPNLGSNRLWCTGVVFTSLFSVGPWESKIQSWLQCIFIPLSVPSHRMNKWLIFHQISLFCFFSDERLNNELNGIVILLNITFMILRTLRF